MVKPHFHSNVRQMLGEDFLELLQEISAFVEPRVDLYRSNECFLISIDLAGAKKEDFSVIRRNHTLSIEGSINNKQKDDRFKVISSERFYGSFRREIPVPIECDMEQLHALLERGILLITIPFYKHKKENHHDFH